MSYGTGAQTGSWRLRGGFGASDRESCWSTVKRVPISPEQFPDPANDDTAAPGGAGEAAVLAGGCFWCVEAVYKQLDGVLEVTSGYAGGSAEMADYTTVSGGATDHAEVVEVRFDPSRISFGQLLKVFFSITHDPTQRDRQGPDVGRQYHSAIFYANEWQKRVAEAYIAQLEEAHVFGAPIVTEVLPLEAFYPAEAYHQDYADRNPTAPYVRYNALPKVEKVRTYFAERLKRS